MSDETREVIYEELFEKATGFAPYPYQRRLALDDNLPSLVSVPTGLGKTAAVVMAWLWRRRFASAPTRDATPRRLAYCLPMRVLVEQTRDLATEWLANLGLAEDVQVHTLVGGCVDREWDTRPECDAVIVGTQDMLLSRALNRGYVVSRFRWPMQFAMLNNDCLWVMDEVQLMGSGLATTAQLQAFRDQLGTVSPVRSLWMSATMKPSWLSTVDFSADGDGLGSMALDEADRNVDGVVERLGAVKPIAKGLSGVTTGGQAEAKLIHEAHRWGTVTLVVVNTVARAVSIHGALRKRAGLEADLILLHSRFRPPERAQALARLLSGAGEHGTIAVCTQVVEAGVDLSARLLVTDLAPWASLVQRFGRCNRDGRLNDAAIIWLNVDTARKGAAAPYDAEDLDNARTILENLKDAGPGSLPNVETEMTYAHVLRRPDLIDLFDTTPDLAGADIDVSRFIRENDEHHVRVFWRGMDTQDPPEDAQRPGRNELCSAPVGEIRDVLRKREIHAWRWDHLDGRWSRVRDVVVPGMVLMLRAADGLYDPVVGWSTSARKPVPVLTAGDAAEDAHDSDSWSQRDWETLADHTDAVAREVDALIAALELHGCEWTGALRTAARWHDAGKAHPVFQEFLLGDDPSGERIGTVWAKSPVAGTRFSRLGFRHELASALAILQQDLPDLSAYLAAAHHGKVRLSIRSLPHETHPGDPASRFARGVWEGDRLGPADLGDGAQLRQIELELSCMELGHGPRGPSWLARMLALRDDPALGPFRLAFLETLLRVADWRASAREGVHHA